MNGPAPAQVVVRTPRLAVVALDAVELVAVRDRARGVLADPLGWAPDYPTDGDVLLAALSLQHGMLPTAAAPWGPLQVRLLAHGPGPDIAVGGIGFKGGPDAEGVVEIGYGLAPSVHGAGLATEAVTGMLELARQFALQAVTAETAVLNLASRRVLVKNGFVVADGPDAGMLWWRRAL